MDRKEVLRLIRERLEAQGLDYETVVNGPEDVVIRIPTEQSNFPAVAGLEESLAKEGVVFDTGYDLTERKREWCLDRSLEIGGTPLASLRHKKAGRTRRKSSYREGDIIKVPLDDRGSKGYGRILMAKPPLILVEFFPVVAKVDPPIETLRGSDWILRLYTTDYAIGQAKGWEIIGHIPVERISKPLLWLEDPLTQKLLLFKDPLDQKWHRETTMNEIRRLRAQPGMVHSDGSARTFLATELKKLGLLR
jgi:hypothetical protein